LTVGGSALRQRVGASGYRPRTRNEPPGGDVSRTYVVASSAVLAVGVGLDPAEEADGDAVSGMELGPPSRDDAVHPTSTSSSATLARARADVLFVLLIFGGGRRIIASKLAG
jgi:hypothetical protein